MMITCSHQHLLYKEEDFTKEEGDSVVGKIVTEVYLTEQPHLLMLSPLLVKMKSGGTEKKRYLAQSMVCSQARSI